MAGGTPIPLPLAAEVTAEEEAVEDDAVAAAAAAIAMVLPALLGELCSIQHCCSDFNLDAHPHIDGNDRDETEWAAAADADADDDDEDAASITAPLLLPELKLLAG